MNELSLTESQLSEAASLNMTLTEYAACLDILRDTNDKMQRMISELDESTARMDEEMQKQGVKPKK